MAFCARLTPRARLALTIALAFSAGAPLAAERADLETPTVEVIGTTPVPGLGTPINEVPANAQVNLGTEMQRKQAINLPDFMIQSLPSVSISEVQNNPFQPNVNYRGFQSSPLLGAPQGLSVFQDGVRINEPFGDVVNWDLIPQNAISSMTLVPGSNPVFGLNTLGGAIEIQTKSGTTHPGFDAQVYGGSFGRKAVEVSGGGYGENVDFFIAGTWFDEDGWRDFSPTEVKQIFAKVGWQNADTDFDLSITHAEDGFDGQRRASPEHAGAAPRPDLYLPGQHAERPHHGGAQWQPLAERRMAALRPDLRAQEHHQDAQWRRQRRL